MRTAVLVLLLASASAPASAQSTGTPQRRSFESTGTPQRRSLAVDGYASVLFDTFPDLDAAAGSQHVAELRARVFAERRQDLGEHVRLQLSGHVDGLLADRTSIGTSGSTTDAIVRPGDLYVDLRSEHFDVRFGMSRIIWGRLDEFQPTDVVNPLDLSRFLLEGRSEGRLPVGLIRGRVFLPGGSSIEALVVPAFRASRFDQLDEPTSPFNLALAGLPTTRHEPAVRAGNAQGGGRFTSTFRRLDWGVSIYRGFRTFPVLDLDVLSLTVEETFPRFTMIGGDFETVRGPWGLRGEVAAFVDDVLQSTAPVRSVPGRTVEGGVGIDRRAGDYRVAANVLYSWKQADDDSLSTDDLSLVVAADRSFARETRTVRALTVYDPEDGTLFVRAIAAISLRDNTWIETSGGLFTGTADDILGRMTRRDVVYARLKVYF